MNRVDVVILAGGVGGKMWPYGLTQAKAILPVGTKPLITRTLDALKRIGVGKITIVGGHLEHQLHQAVADYERSQDGEGLGGYSFLSQPNPNGTAAALDLYLQHADKRGDLLVLFGDVLFDEGDLRRLIEHHRAANPPVSMLVTTLEGATPNDWLCAQVVEGRVRSVWAHPRDGVSHRFTGAFMFSDDAKPFVSRTGEYGAPVQVGVMPTQERDLITTLASIIAADHEVRAIECVHPTVDLDKPWQLLEANRIYVRRTAGMMQESVISEEAYVDPRAQVKGHLHLADGARIEGHCIINGNVIVGANTIIRDGAIINGNAVIGESCSIANYCLIEKDSVIGDRCVVDHTAEFDGVLMENVYLYHYMEIAGVVGRSSDIGAGSVCGTLRFDDGRTVHRIRGRAEQPRIGANVAYIGDFCRLGVNAILMPGVKTGAYSLVGPGVILHRDLPERTRIMVEQNLTTASWGPERYGW